MPKKIRETTERWCCDPWKDLVAKPNPEGWRRREPKWKVCKHCGALHEYYRFMDPAGSMDYDWKPVNE